MSKSFPTIFESHAYAAKTDFGQGNRKHPLRRENFHDTFEVRGAHRLDLGRKFRCARAHLGAHIFYTGKCTHFLKHFLLVLWLNFGAHRGAHYILCWKIHTIFKTFSLSFAVKFWCAPRCAHILCWKMHTFFKTFSLSFAVKFRCQISKDSSRFDIFARHMVGILTNFEKTNWIFFSKIYISARHMIGNFDQF